MDSYKVQNKLELQNHMAGSIIQSDGVIDSKTYTISSNSYSIPHLEWKSSIKDFIQLFTISHMLLKNEEFLKKSVY